jgi:hypothetical protein
MLVCIMNIFLSLKGLDWNLGEMNKGTTVYVYV